jgi:hypothetical protein
MPHIIPHDLFRFVASFRANSSGFSSSRRQYSHAVPIRTSGTAKP